jgi:hypothetical protein
MVTFLLSKPGRSLKGIKPPNGEPEGCRQRAISKIPSVSKRFSARNPEPSKQQSEATHRPRSNIYLKETGPGKGR